MTWRLAPPGMSRSSGTRSVECGLRPPCASSGSPPGSSPREAPDQCRIPFRLLLYGAVQRVVTALAGSTSPSRSGPGRGRFKPVRARRTVGGGCAEPRKFPRGEAGRCGYPAENTDGESLGLHSAWRSTRWLGNRKGSGSGSSPRRRERSSRGASRSSGRRFIRAPARAGETRRRRRARCSIRVHPRVRGSGTRSESSRSQPPVIAAFGGLRGSALTVYLRAAAAASPASGFGYPAATLSRV